MKLDQIHNLVGRRPIDCYTQQGKADGGLTVGYWARRRETRRHRQTLLVLWTLDTLKRGTGLDVIAVTGLSVRAVYVALARMEDDGLITSDLEVPESHPDARPRQYYWTTVAGQRRAITLAEEMGMDQAARR